MLNGPSPLPVLVQVSFLIYLSASVCTFGPRAAEGQLLGEDAVEAWTFARMHMRSLVVWNGATFGKKTGDGCIST